MGVTHRLFASGLPPANSKKPGHPVVPARRRLGVLTWLVILYRLGCGLPSGLIILEVGELTLMNKTF